MRTVSASVVQLPALTSLRFLAALAVVVLHYRDLLGVLPPWVMKGVIGGQYGMTFFFVLSGFILTYKYNAWFSDGVNDGDYWRFQRFRLARLYPIYVFGLLLDTPWHIFERARVGGLANDGHTYWASWLLNLVGLQAWVPAVPYSMYWNTPAWSVSAEFFFYATFPFAASFLARRVASLAALAAWFAGTIAVGTALFAVVYYFLAYKFHVEPLTQYLMTLYPPILRYSEFLAGCLAGLYFVRLLGGARYAGSGILAAEWGRNLLVCASLLFVAWRVWSPEYTGPSAALWLLSVSGKYTIVILPFTIMIVAIACGHTFLSRLLEHPAMVLLGEASYALYMIHWSVTTFIRMGYLGRWDTPLIHGVCLLATVGLSVLCYRLIEVPCRVKLRGPPANRHAAPSYAPV